MSRSEQERQLASILPRVSRGWRRLADRALAEFGISNSAGWCLIYIDRMGESTRQGDLAREIGVREASLVRTLDLLQAAGLVGRRPDPDDRRANHLLLTDEGRALASRIEARLVAVRSDLLAVTPDADLAATLRVCEVLLERLEP